MKPKEELAVNNKETDNKLARKLLTDDDFDKMFEELQRSRKEAEIKRSVEPIVRLKPEEIKYNKK